MLLRRTRIARQTLVWSPNNAGFAERTVAVRNAAKAAGASPVSADRAKADFRSYCADQSADPVQSGVPVAHFVQYLRDVRASGRTTELLLRDMGCFVFDGPTMRLSDAEADSAPLGHEADIAAFAASLPPDGLDADAAKAALSAQHPNFSPKGVGCISVRDALNRFPHLVNVASEGAGEWRVRRVAQSTARATGASEGAGDTSAAPAMSDAEVLAALDTALLEAYNTRSARLGRTAGDRGVWEDIEPLLRTVPASLRDAVKDLPAALANLPSMQTSATELLRPARRLRGVNLFVDGDGLTSLHLDAILSRVRVDVAASSAKVVRAAATPALTTEDAITPLDIPTYMAVEAAAEHLRRSEALVLRDVVYVCSDAKVDTYAAKVAHAVKFPDAEVWVVSPARELCVASWKVDAASDVEATA